MRIPLRKIDLSFANVIKDMIMSGVQSGIDITFSTLTKVFNFEILVDDSSIEIDSVNNHLQIKTDGVQNSHLNPNCAGSGLTQDVNGALQPDIDNTTIEINSSNKLAVKDMPITFNSAEMDEDGLRGQPVYVKNTGHIAKARASPGYQKFVGLLVSDTPAGFSGKYQCDGMFILNDWTNITGSVNLTPQDIYYLSDTDYGKLTNNPSTLSGFCVKIGIALNTTTLEIKNDINILL
jgi:hypothetical protein